MFTYIRSMCVNVRLLPDYFHLSLSDTVLIARVFLVPVSVCLAMIQDSVSKVSLFDCYCSCLNLLFI